VSSSKPRVIVADDDPMIRSLVAELVTQLGAVPIKCADGLDAFRAYLERRIDGVPVALLVLDNSMPPGRTTGVDVLRRIRKRGDQCTPVILFTGSDVRDDVEANGGIYVSKGDTTRDLVAAITTALGASQAAGGAP